MAARGFFVCRAAGGLSPTRWRPKARGAAAGHRPGPGSAARAACEAGRLDSGVWKPAIRATGVPDNRHNGMHVLRHTYASVLLDAGENVKALSAYLGHSDPGFTLRIYTLLLPASKDHTRRAIDHAFADDPQTPDGLETA